MLTWWQVFLLIVNQLHRLLRNCLGLVSFPLSGPWNVETYGAKKLIHRVFSGPFSLWGPNWQSNGSFHRHRDAAVWEGAQVCALFSGVKSVPGSFAFLLQLLSLILLVPTVESSNKLPPASFWWWPNTCSRNGKTLIAVAITKLPGFLAMTADGHVRSVLCCPVQKHPYQKGLRMFSF